MATQKPIKGTVGNTPQSIMGVTVLAAGTSIPDAISSVLVAREVRWLPEREWQSIGSARMRVHL